MMITHRQIAVDIFFVGMFSSALIAHAQALPVKLPYLSGQSFVVVQGYNTLPTHIKKDSYALDFSQNGCGAYGKPVVAALGGTAVTVQQDGYNGGYGTEIVINHGNNLVSRYAHMIPQSINAGVGTLVQQGRVIGLIGDTGLVAGLACPEHPGTHLHFAMDIRANDGTLTAYDPEPISGYRNITTGRWYLSDNSEGAPVDLSIDATSTAGKVLGAQTTASSQVLPVVSSVPRIIIPPTGGVSISLPLSQLPLISLSSLPELPLSVLPTSSLATVTSSASASGILFQQTDDSAQSAFSWDDDNWFNLGNGFSGTLNELALEGKVSNPDYFASHVALQEFKDPHYAAMVQQFPISDDAPFTKDLATTTFTGLSIPLKPYFYYRLYTIQDYQNRSVILAGTNTTGTMMWDTFVYGVGRVESTSTFMPFITMEGIVATSTLSPPALTSPTNLATSFDPTAMTLNLSFSTSTDPDWPENPLHYELNYSTSTVFDPAKWGTGFPIPVTIGNSYLLGVRAVDAFGDISAMATMSWNFPPGFVSYHLSNGLEHAEQEFTVSTTTQLNSIGIFTTNFQTSAGNISGVGCSLSLSYRDPSSSQEIISSDNAYYGYRCGGDLMFSFASSPPVLLPGILYRWIFDSPTGNPTTNASVQFYGRDDDTAGGPFSDPSLANARFILNASSGVIFAN